MGAAGSASSSRPLLSSFHFVGDCYCGFGLRLPDDLVEHLRPLAVWPSTSVKCLHSFPPEASGFLTGLAAFSFRYMFQSHFSKLDHPRRQMSTHPFPTHLLRSAGTWAIPGGGSKLSLGLGSCCCQALPQPVPCPESSHLCRLTQGPAREPPHLGLSWP